MALHTMSFTVSADEVRARTIDVTRRLGFEDVLAMDRIQAMDGDKPIALLLAKAVAREPLADMVSYYDQDECNRMGFPELTPYQYVRMFRLANGIKALEVITRIQFEYVDVAGSAHTAKTTINPAQAWPFPTKAATT